jgi:hypothetical protein
MRTASFALAVAVSLGLGETVHAEPTAALRVLAQEKTKAESARIDRLVITDLVTGKTYTYTRGGHVNVNARGKATTSSMRRGDVVRRLPPGAYKVEIEGRCYREGCRRVGGARYTTLTDGKTGTIKFDVDKLPATKPTLASLQRVAEKLTVRCGSHIYQSWVGHLSRIRDANRAAVRNLDRVSSPLEDQLLAAMPAPLGKSIRDALALPTPSARANALAKLASTPVGLSGRAKQALGALTQLRALKQSHLDTAEKAVAVRNWLDSRCSKKKPTTKPVGVHAPETSRGAPAKPKLVKPKQVKTKRVCKRSGLIGGVNCVTIRMEQGQ